ncbi:hypothetical protein HDU96_010264 [Phlyctochytrium bullatum]|nr:hypothetical protein HDU96_010264 [Phlyctochytrium bullatum]
MSSASASAWLPLLLSFVAGGGTFLGGCLLVPFLPSRAHLLTLHTPSTRRRNSHPSTDPDTITESPSSSPTPGPTSLAPLFAPLQSLAAGIMLLLSLHLLLDAIPHLSPPLLLVLPAIGYGLMALAARWLATWETEGGGWVEGIFGGGAGLRTSLVTFVGLALHNLPEGASVALSTAADLKLGVEVCAAILLHNVLGELSLPNHTRTNDSITEGMVVALPLHLSTKGNIPRVLLLTFLNGLAEPLGVVAAWTLLALTSLFFPSTAATPAPDTPAVPGIHAILCTVSGVMACISFSELIPGARDWMARRGRSRSALQTLEDWVVGFVVKAGAGWRKVPDDEETGDRERRKGRGGWVEIEVRVWVWVAVGALAGYAVILMAEALVDELSDRNG